MNRLMTLLCKVLALTSFFGVALAHASPSYTYTFEFTVTSGSSAVGSSFQRSFTTGYFGGSPVAYDFGGGLSMVKVEAYSYSDFTSSPFEHEVRSIFPTLSPSSLNSAMRSAALYAELAYYLPGGMPQDSAGQVVLRSSLSQLTPLGGGGFFYDNYFFDAGFAGGRGLIDFTPEEVANWFLDKGEIRWREGASREYCATAVGPCVVSGFLDWSGTAHLVSFSTGQSSDVSEPRSLLLIGLGLFAVVYCRRRRISYMTVSNHSGQ